MGYTKTNPKTKPKTNTPRKKRAYRRTKSKKEVKVIDYRGLCVKRFTENCKLTMKRAREEEKGIYEYTNKLADELTLPKTFENRKYRDIYFNKQKSLYINLLDNSYVNNISLKKRMKTDIKPGELAYLTPQELYPEKWKDDLDEQARKNKNKYEQRKEIATDMFQCGRCKKWETIYHEKQTRSGDESMTCFIRCLNCNKEWRQ